MAQEREWERVAVETVKVGDGVIRTANMANYTCTKLEVFEGWVTLGGGIRVGNPGERQVFTEYTESYRAGEQVWCLRR